MGRRITRKTLIKTCDELSVKCDVLKKECEQLLKRIDEVIERTDADEDNEPSDTVNADTKHLSCPDGWEPEYQGMHGESRK